MSRAQVGPPPSPQLFFETVNAFHKTEALKTAIGLPVHTSRRAADAEDIAALATHLPRYTHPLRLLWSTAF